MNPPIPVIWICKFIIKWSFLSMIALSYEIEPGDKGIKWISYDSDHLICIEYRSFWHYPWRMCLTNPSGIVNNIFALESLHLHDDFCV